MRHIRSDYVEIIIKIEVDDHIVEGHYGFKGDDIKVGRPSEDEIDFGSLSDYEMNL